VTDRPLSRREGRRRPSRLEPDDLSVDGAITKARAEGEVAAREFVEHRGEADPNATCGSRRPAYCA
jgi:hypothetical protein